MKFSFYKRFTLLFMFLFTSFLLTSLTTGCNCGPAPKEPVADSATKPEQQTEIIKTDAAEQKPEANPDKCLEFGDVCESDTQCQKCGNGSLVCHPVRKRCSYGNPGEGLGPDKRSCTQIEQSCNDDQECINCNFLSCSGGVCINNPPLPDNEPDKQQCPSRCSSNGDCPVNLCGARTSCVNGVCSWPPRVCPKACQSDQECQTPVCGKRIRCLQGSCSELPKCPSVCKTNQECQTPVCGPMQACVNNVCVEPIKNTRPVAIAEKSQRTQVGTRVQLSGKKSYDLDKDKLTFQWSFLSKPAKSLTVFDDSTSTTPAFIPDREGNYQLQLVVNDGKVNSKPSTLLIIASKLPPTAQPKISSISPTTLQEGQQVPIMKLFGSGFISGSKVSFNGLILPTTYVNTTELSIALLSNLKTGSYPIFVTNPDGQKSNIVMFKVTAAPKKAPRLIRISPVEVKAGTAFKLKALGEFFISGASIVFDGKAQPTTFASSTSLLATIPAQIAGVYTISVKNPNGQSSASLTLKVVKVQLGPILQSLSPNAIFAKSTATLMLTGDRFVKGAQVSVGNQKYLSTFVSSKILTVSVSAATPGNLAVFVINPNGKISNKLLLLVKQALTKPILLRLIPSTILEGKAVTIAIRGNDFVKGAKATVGTKSYTTTYVSRAELRLTLPATIKPGGYPVQVTNPDNQKSNTLTLTVKAKPPAPVLVSVNPNRVASTASAVLIMRGKNFMKGAQIQIGTNLYRSSFGSSAELKVSLPRKLPVGTFSLFVINPDGQKSNALPFETYKAPAPILTKLNPAFGISGTIVTIQMFGSNFQTTSTGVFQSGAQNTRYVSSKELVMTLSLSSLGTGNYSIWVRNSDGQVSAKLTFKVQPPKGPQLLKLLPNKGSIGQKISGLADGSGFVKGAVLLMNGKTFKTTFLNAKTLGVIISLTGFKAGTYPAIIVNPNKQKSNIVYFTVSAKKLPAPILTSVTPTTISFSKTKTIYLLGKNFQNGAQLMLPIPFAGVIGLPTNFINSNTLVVTVQLPRIPFPFPARNVKVYVKNPDNQKSNNKAAKITK